MGYWLYTFEHGPSLKSKQFIESADLIELVTKFGKVVVDYNEGQLATDSDTKADGESK